MCVVKVKGVLGFVLNLSRLTGISLIRLKRCKNGYDASFSNPTALYGFWSMTLAYILGVIGLFLQVLFNDKFPTAHILYVIIIITLSVIFWCNAKAKTKLMLNHLAVLNKITNNLNYSIIRPGLLIKKHLALCLGCFVFYFSVTSLTFIKCVLMAENLEIYIFLSLIYPNLQIFVVETLMITLKYKVYEALKSLTGELGHHLRLVKIDYPSVVSTKICIRNTGNAYVTVCKVIEEINEKDGKFCIFLITSLLLSIVHANCDVVYRIFNDYNTFDIVYDVLWISSFVFRLYVIIEPCHDISKEAVKLQVIFSKLMCYTTAVGTPCFWEWDVILYQLQLLQPSFTAFGMLTLDRTFFISIISVTTTYLAIAIPHTKKLYKNITFV